jgi:hypothetical protein
VIVCIIIVAALAACAFMLYKLYNKKIKQHKNYNGKGHNPINIVVKTDFNIDASVIENIKPIIKRFRGSMNALYEIANSKNDDGSENIVFENIYQTIESHGNDDLKRWFSLFQEGRDTWDSTKYKQKATYLLGLLSECGVKGINESQVEWDDVVAKHYRRFTNISSGQTCEVLAPYWIYDDDVFEQGVVKPF